MTNDTTSILVRTLTEHNFFHRFGGSVVIESYTCSFTETVLVRAWIFRFSLNKRCHLQSKTKWIFYEFDADIRNCRWKTGASTITRFLDQRQIFNFELNTNPTDSVRHIPNRGGIFGNSVNNSVTMTWRNPTKLKLRPKSRGDLRVELIEPNSWICRLVSDFSTTLDQRATSPVQIGDWKRHSVRKSKAEGFWTKKLVRRQQKIDRWNVNYRRPWRKSEIFFLFASKRKKEETRKFWGKFWRKEEKADRFWRRETKHFCFVLKNPTRVDRRRNRSDWSIGRHETGRDDLRQTFSWRRLMHLSDAPNSNRIQLGKWTKFSERIFIEISRFFFVKNRDK